MANITGTAGADTLQGTNNRDEIFGLGGDDIIFGGLGRDTIDGGTGNDTLDYSKYDGGLGGSSGIFLDVLETGIVTISKGKSGDGDDIVPIGTETIDNVVNIETIIGNPNKINSIFILDGFNQTAKDGQLDLDFSKNTFGYFFPSVGKKTINIKNFSSTLIYTGSTNDRVKGDDRDNLIFTGAGDDTIIASKGNDQLFKAETIDYSNLDNAVTVSALWNIIRLPKSAAIVAESVQNIEKGGVGTDLVRDAKKIIGTNNKSNTLDVSASNKDVKDLSIDINLSKNFIKVNGIPKTQNVAITQLEIVNFTNVIGSTNNDTIVGANKKGKLTGGGGNDTITGGNKNDILTGSDSTARGVGEVDSLTGGGGRDKFVLGDANGAYYVGKGKDDYATITDFNLFQDSIDLGGFKDYSFASGTNNSIELYSGKDVNTRDLIAKIQIAGGISNRSTNSRSVMGSDASLNAITSKIDILSGSSSNAEA